jgi:predicted anti-sigma-YlaC factor YlaD
MGCREIRDKLELFAAQELTPEDRAQVEAHLKACDACREALAKVRRLEDLLLTVPVPPVPEGFAGRVVAQARAQQAAPARPKPAFRLKQSAWKRFRVSVGTAAALAAGLLLGISMGYQTWQSSRSEVANASSDLLATSGIEYLAQPGGDSLAESYLSLTTVGNR